jgi:hypothetical protein
MPMTSVKLIPGVNVERTQSVNEAGISQSQMIRYKDGLVQTMGGWQSLFGVTIPSTVRDLHAWLDITGRKWLGVGATANLIAITSTGSVDITPQTRLSSFAPSFSVSSGSNVVTVNDPNSNVSIYDAVFFNTPVALDGILLNNGYQVVSVLSSGSYQINAANPATTTVSSSGVLPVFATTSGSPTVTVTLPSNNFIAQIGLQQSFRAPTSVGGLLIQGGYTVTSIIDSTNFTITTQTQSTTTTSTTMNNGLAQLNYYVVQGPPGALSGFGAGGFGSGGFGIGSSTTTGGLGAPITTTDWSLDNWGEILLACPKDGAIYAWSPDSGFSQAQVVAAAPFFNGGIFISQPQQILVAWRSVQSTGTQDNLIVRWSDIVNFNNWVASNQTAAGSFHIPTGSQIIGGLQAPNYGVIWTDVDVWIMQYVGGTVIFNFTRVGSGCGLIGPHAANVIGGLVYWCSNSNFFVLGPTGAVPLPCPVWDYIFQNLSTANAIKIYCAPNSTFNELAWFFPSVNATENDSYVKFNIVENEWDFGNIIRTAWIDVSVLGNPVGADSSGFIWQHEMGQSYPGAGAPSFRTGWFALSDGNDMVFVDWALPDFIWSLYSGTKNAQVNITFFTVDYPGDQPRVYGPFTVTQATEFIAPRLRGRLVSLLITSNNNIFWRLGRVRMRFAISGRR